jgi:hypothetical protein
MQVAALDQTTRRPVFGDQLHPGRGPQLHQRIRNEQHVHSVQHRRQNAVPQPDLTFEVQHADDCLALRVVARHRQRPAMVDHRLACHRDAHHAALLVGGVLNVGHRIVRDATAGRVEVLGGFGQVLGDEPVQAGPTLQFGHLAGRRFGQTLQAGFGGQGDLNAAGAEQETDLLGWRVGAGERQLDGQGHQTAEHAAVPGGEETVMKRIFVSFSGF